MSYEPPWLQTSELVECFRELNINVSVQDFTEPNPRKWHEIYSRIFEMMAFRPIEQVIQIQDVKQMLELELGWQRAFIDKPKTILDLKSLFKLERMHTEFPDLFEEGFAQMAFTISMRSILACFGFQGFCIKDVIQPSPKRLHKISSIFINAVRHVQHRKQVADEIFERIQSRRSQFEAVLNQNKNLKEYLGVASESQPQREAELHKLQAELEPEKQSCFELNKLHEEEKRTIEEYKLQLAEIEAGKENLKQQLTVMSHDVEKISNKIVQSPKRFKKDLDRHKNKVDELKSELAKKEQSLSENRLLLEQTVNKLTTAEKTVKQTKEVLSDRDMKNEVVADVQRQTEARLEQKELYSKYCMLEEDVAEKLGVREEQKKKLSGQINFRGHTIYEQLADHRRYQDKTKEAVEKLKMETSQGGLATATCYKDISSLDKIVEEKKVEKQREVADAVAEALTVMEMVNEEFQNLNCTLLEAEDE